MLRPRYIPEIFLGALLATALFALGFAVAFSFYQPQKNEAAQSAQQASNASGSDQRLADYTWTLDWLTFFMVISNIGLWLQARRSARIAERALTELEAPFVFVDITLPGIGVRPDGGVNWGPLQWNVVNYGRTPASLLETLGEIRIIAFEQTPDPIRPVDHPGQQLPYGVVAPPNGGRAERGFNPAAAVFTQTGPPGRPFTTHSPFFLGFVRYEDIFGKTFILGFCFIFERHSGTWVRMLGDDYNYCRPVN
jgi:hypothetical protein